MLNLHIGEPKDPSSIEQDSQTVKDQNEDQASGDNLVASRVNLEGEATAGLEAKKAGESGANLSEQSKSGWSQFQF